MALEVGSYSWIEGKYLNNKWKDELSISTQTSGC